MTPEQKIKWAILVQLSDYEDCAALKDYNITEENVDDLYDEYSDCVWDILYEFREGQVETNITPQYSRNYESQSVAAKMPDGTWVGWTYWYGGGKHGEPEAINWMNESYFLDCAEEEKLIVVQTFTKKEN